MIRIRDISNEILAMNNASASEESSQKSAKDEEEEELPKPFKTLRKVRAQQIQNISYRPWVLGSREAPKVQVAHR